MPYFGQEMFEQANAKGPLDDPAYLDARATRRGAWRAPEGIDAALKAQHLDALIAPAMSPAWLTDLVLGDHFVGAGYGAAAVAGYSEPHRADGRQPRPADRHRVHRAGVERSEAAVDRLCVRAAQQARKPPQFLPTVTLRRRGTATQSVDEVMRAMRPLSPLAQRGRRRRRRSRRSRSSRARDQSRAVRQRVDAQPSGRPRCTSDRRRSTPRRSDNRAAPAALPPSCRVRADRSARARAARCASCSKSPPTSSMSSPIGVATKRCRPPGTRCGMSVSHARTTAVRRSRRACARAAAPPLTAQHVRPTACARCTCRSRRTRLRPSALPGPSACSVHVRPPSRVARTW